MVSRRDIIKASNHQAQQVTSEDEENAFVRPARAAKPARQKKQQQQQQSNDERDNDVQTVGNREVIMMKTKTTTTTNFDEMRMGQLKQVGAWRHQDQGAALKRGEREVSPTPTGAGGLVDELSSGQFHESLLDDALSFDRGPHQAGKPNKWPKRATNDHRQQAKSQRSRAAPRRNDEEEEEEDEDADEEEADMEHQQELVKSAGYEDDDQQRQFGGRRDGLYKNFDPYSIYGDEDEEEDVWYSEEKLQQVSSLVPLSRPSVSRVCLCVASVFVGRRFVCARFCSRRLSPRTTRRFASPTVHSLFLSRSPVDLVPVLPAARVVVLSNVTTARRSARIICADSGRLVYDRRAQQ